MKARKIVDSLTERLECTQKVIASFMGISETALSTSLDNPIAEIRENKVGKRLLSLCYIVETLARDESLTPSVIKKILVAPYYPREDGTYLDVVTAIHLGTIQNDLLTPIADAALKHFRNNYESEKLPVANGLYNRAVGERKMAAGGR